MRAYGEEQVVVAGPAFGGEAGGLDEQAHAVALCQLLAAELHRLHHALFHQRQRSARQLPAPCHRAERPAGGAAQLLDEGLAHRAKQGVGAQRDDRHAGLPLLLAERVRNGVRDVLQHRIDLAAARQRNGVVEELGNDLDRQIFGQGNVGQPGDGLSHGRPEQFAEQAELRARRPAEQAAPLLERLAQCEQRRVGARGDGAGKAGAQRPVPFALMRQGNPFPQRVEEAQVDVEALRQARHVIGGHGESIVRHHLADQVGGGHHPAPARR